MCVASLQALNGVKHGEQTLATGSASDQIANKVDGYRAMLRIWRAAGIMTFCGHILGLPGDSVASIERDIAIHRELPLDLLPFFIDGI